MTTRTRTTRQLTIRERDARRQALEEAAAVCERADEWLSAQHGSVALRLAARQIRALADGGSR